MHFVVRCELLSISLLEETALAMTSDNINVLQNLLQKLAPKVKEKEEELNQRKREGGFFNIFFSANIWKKEVQICRLLWDLLSPEGSHGLGSLFLSLFNQTVLEQRHRMDLDEIRQARVYREDYTDGRRRIDLTIKTNIRYIPIEVKLKAGDSDDQCLDYFRHVADQSIDKLNRPVLYYLTLDGHEPSPESMGNLIIGDNLILISFYEHIVKWLDSCLLQPEVNSRINVKCILTQFRDCIKEYDRGGRAMKNYIHDELSEDLFKCISNLDAQEKELAVRICHSFTKKQNSLWNRFIERFEQILRDKQKLLRRLPDHDHVGTNSLGREYVLIERKTSDGHNVTVALFLYSDRYGAYIAYRIYVDKVLKDKPTPDELKSYQDLFPNSLKLKPHPTLPWIYYEKFPQFKEGNVSLVPSINSTLLLLFDEYLDEYLNERFIPRIRELTCW